MCLCSLVDSIRRFIRMIGTKKKKGERQMMTRYIATIDDYKTEKKAVVGDYVSKESALGALMIRMQLTLMDHVGGDASIEFRALKTCGSTDNGEDVLYIQANGYNSETREMADIAGYIWQYGDGEEEY